jgi:hypothetical protein
MDSTENVEECCELFYDLLNAVIADNVPAAKTFVTRLPHWYSEDIISAYKDNRRAHRRWKRSQQQSDYIDFSEKRRLFKYKVDIDEQIYKNKLQDDLCSDYSKLFKFANNKMKSKRIPNVIKYRDVTLKDIAESFSSFFKENMNLDNDTMSSPQTTSTEVHSICNCIFREDLQGELEALQCNKSVGSDPLPSKIIKNCAVELSHPLYISYNKILQYNSYSSRWKVAHITPVHKKGKKYNIENYRPISLLPIFSKIFEKFLYKILFNEIKTIFLLRNMVLFPKNQQ